MMRFNLSEWAIAHRALVLFMILVLGGAGAFSYLNLGRAEDPSFTIKSMVVNVAWPGATASTGRRRLAMRRRWGKPWPGCTTGASSTATSARPTSCGTRCPARRERPS